MKDPTALYESLVRQHARDLYRVAWHMCGDSSQAEDLVQECFVEAWRGITRLRNVASARAWLIQILRRRWHRALPQVVRRRAIESTDDAADVIASPSRTEEDTADRDWTRAALMQLEPSHREVFLLAVMEGFHCREVAEMLDIPLGTVLSRLHRARGKLRQHFEEQEARAARDPKVRRLHETG